ncbi:molybdate ABC transporter substrate-binding protein [Nocardioides sp.]|uniref:molybdate ABC transporter substrate-binding protein n=1 Tax=Nocardioides sp. TaxID=35761 RepID=UPI0025ED9EF6|nr:molybdate ABC transporter substrate-binding protein [Nocardioides sp.]
MRRLAPAAASVALLLSLAGCGGSDDEATTLTVYAAASLTSTFEQLADEFEQEHPGTEVQLSFGGSSDLVTQIKEGAHADVFASADLATMQKLTDDDLADGDPQDFATNTLEIAVPPGNPAGITGLADLATPGVNLVVCAPEVPCGAATRAVADAAGVALSPVSEEQSVTDVLAKVTSGEADAGLVYRTDVQAAGEDVRGIELPEADSAVNTYPIVVVQGADEAALAHEFVDLVLGAAGQQVLADAGFGPP